MASCRESPMFFIEDAEADVARLKQLQADDPIAWQDALNTSRALVEAVKENDVDELRRVVANADEGELIQALHLVCELVDRENFSNSWRILKTLKEGNAFGAIDINTPRSSDGWTPLCIACADACLPLAFKLLELNADPNVITRSNDTPLSLAKRGQPEDNEEQREARGIISNMLRSYGAQDSYKDVLRISRKQSTAGKTRWKAE
ncbi:unnamed protein product [Durusdinium trenchii]|uniref:Ankyrin repeat protein n=1 Tax=Durusdinium trenchii TaxID=1381693 RepID=A0ABP0JTC8_9DINO